MNVKGALSGTNYLDQKDNWELVYQTSKLVPIVKMLVNTPLDASQYS